MCCTSSSGSLSRLGVTLGLLSLVTLVTAFVSNVWVFTREPVTLPQTHTITSITFKIGFWRACPSVSRNNISGHIPSPACQLIKYSPWDEIYNNDLGVSWTPLEFTPSFVTKMRVSMPFAAVSLVLTLLASMFALIGHCNADHKTLVACGLYTLAGLTLASGLVVFVSVLSDAFLDRPRRPSGPQPAPAFHYRYGWSFFTAGVAFILAEVAALLSMTAYLKRFPTVEDMVRAMVPGAERRLQERQLCKEFLVKRSGSAALHHPAATCPGDTDGCDGPLLTTKTPPDICSTNTLAEGKGLGLHPAATPTLVPITLMHKRPANGAYPGPGQPITFQFPTTNCPRYATIGSSCGTTIVHQGVLGVAEGNGTTSSSGSSASSAGVVTSSGSSSLSSRNFQSLPRARKHSTPASSGFSTLQSTKRSGSPSSISQGYCSGGTGQPIIIHSDEEIV